MELSLPILAVICASIAYASVLIGVLTASIQNIQKKNRVRLSLEEKLRIAESVAKGAKPVVVAAEFGVSMHTVYRCLRDSADNMSFAARGPGNKKMKSKRRPVADEIDEAVHKWFLEQRALNITVTGALLRTQAEKVYKESGRKESFTASAGWLYKFQLRHGIRQLSKQGERKSADEEGALAFVVELMDFIAEEGFEPDDIYNMDETGVCWKSLPRKTLAAATEKRVDGEKAFKDRFTAAMCSNASGTHRLPLLVIGKYKAPHCFRNAPSLPVDYRAQYKAWMTTFHFRDWLTKCFVPYVELHQLRSGRTGKVLLLLDNCSSHTVPPTMDLGKVTVKMLPPNTTSLIQPMDQGIIAKTKRTFQRKLLKKIVDSGVGLKTFYKSYNLLDAIIMLDQAWKDLTPENLKNSWRKLLPLTDDQENDAPTNDAEPNFADMLGQIGSNVTQNDINEWLAELRDAEKDTAGAGADNDMERNFDDSVQSSDDDEDHGLIDAFEKVVKWARKQPAEIKTAIDRGYAFFTRQ